MIFSLILLIQSVSVSLQGGAVMPDGKVDKVVDAPKEWHAPVWGVNVGVDFAPDWQALKDWNNATIGVGLSY